MTDVWLTGVIIDHRPALFCHVIVWYSLLIYVTLRLKRKNGRSSIGKLAVVTLGKGWLQYSRESKAIWAEPWILFYVLDLQQIKRSVVGKTLVTCIGLGADLDRDSHWCFSSLPEGLHDWTQLVGADLGTMLLFGAFQMVTGCRFLWSSRVWLL